MKRSNRLAYACSAVLLGAWATQGVANDNATKHKNSTQSSATQTQSQATAKNEVSKKAGQPTNVLVTGEITDARNVTLASTAGDQHRLLKVQPQSGEAVIVDIGMRDSTMNKFEKGDRIVAMGKPARINGKPVLFAANVAEMERVGRTGKSDSKSNQPSSTASDQSNRTASTSSDSVFDSVIYLFETDNLAQDDYGVYDEDFAWETNDGTFDSWNDSEAVAWDDTERAHYGVLGYDDAGEEGLWDW